MGSTNSHQPPAEGEVMAIVFAGIDLAKNVLAVHGVTEAGKPARFFHLLELFSNRGPRKSKEN